MNKQDQIEEILVGIQKSKTKYRAIIQASIAKWVKDFQDGNKTSVDDLKKLIEIDLQLQKDDYVMAKNQQRK
ncbi:hypothetical protein P4V54_09455 [Brevibacillus nitrificans]|uniref:hypothetical protein n=1 Tax=Brevibacillus nitrificans TaxID=651560 RepID=UPI002E21139D|nr:hypothetical protein [Brevibacillus nitrificans]